MKFITKKNRTFRFLRRRYEESDFLFLKRRRIQRNLGGKQNEEKKK